jgi:hypothetical protein
MAPYTTPLPRSVKASLNNVRNTQDLDALFGIHREEERRVAMAPNAWDRRAAGMQGRDVHAGRKYYPELSEGKKDDEGACCVVM